MKSVNPRLSARNRLFKPCSCPSASFLPTPPLYPSPPTHPRSRFSDVNPYRPANGTVLPEVPLKSRRTKLKGVKENRAPACTHSFPQEHPVYSDRKSRHPSKSPILVPVTLAEIREKGKADLRKGCFSHKQAILGSNSYSEDCYSTPVVRLNIRSLATEPDSQTARGPRSSSPGLTARSRRFQQLSRHYRLDRKSLQREVRAISYSSISLKKDQYRRYATPERLPSADFMSELEGITRISDYSEW